MQLVKLYFQEKQYRDDQEVIAKVRGVLLVSDDKAGVVYRIGYRGVGRGR
jgi:hypothetical protein